MARKKAVETVKDQLQAQADLEATKFLGEEVNEGAVAEDKNPIEEHVEEIKKTKKDEKVEEPVKEEGVDFDPEQLKKDIAEEVKKYLPNQTKEEAKETKDAIDLYLEQAEKEGRNPTWKEAIKILQEETTKKVRAELAQEEENRQKAIEEANQTKAENEKKQQEAFNRYVDEQLTELKEAGKFDPTNETERKALFSKMLEVNQERVQKGKAPIYSIKEIFYEHYKPTTTQPAGVDAPVSPGKTAPVDSGDDYSYSDLKKPWTFFGMNKK